MRRLASLTIISQGVSSFGNFLLALLVARTASASEFGAFGIYYGFVFVWAILARSVLSEPLLVFGPDGCGGNAVRLARSAGAVVAGIGMLVGILGVLVGVPFVGLFAISAVALAVLPLYDLRRAEYLSQRRVHRALSMDVAWLILQVVLVVSFSVGGSADAEWVFASWVIALLVVSILFGAVRIRLDIDAVREWTRVVSARYGPWNLVDSLGTVLSDWTSYLALGIAGGLAATGVLRSGLLLSSPLNVLFLATPQVLLPLRDSKSPILRYAPVALALSVALWFGLVALVPADVGEWLAGDRWQDGIALLGPLLIINLSRSYVTVERCRRLRETNLRSMSLILISTTLTGAVLVLLVGREYGGIGGAWVLAAMSVIGAVLIYAIGSRPSTDS